MAHRHCARGVVGTRGGRMGGDCLFGLASLAAFVIIHSQLKMSATSCVVVVMLDECWPLIRPHCGRHMFLRSKPTWRAC